jgi:hypothetical protein
MLKKALNALRAHLRYYPIGLGLIKEPFYIIDLQSLYEAIQAKPLDARHFQKRLIDLDFVFEDAESDPLNPRFFFDRREYEYLQQEGYYFRL